MRKFLTSLLLTCAIFGSCCASAHAQEKKAEARDGATVPYLFAGIGLILVMVLVCMPARRD